MIIYWIDEIMKHFTADFFKGWLYHLLIFRQILFISNRKKWLFEHMDSLVILILTLATLILIILVESTGSGIFYFIPTGRSYFDQKIGLP